MEKWESGQRFMQGIYGKGPPERELLAGKSGVRIVVGK
jgi:hypothetical protein